MKRISFLIGLLATTFSAWAQSPVAVTATVASPVNSAPYIYGTYTIRLVDSNGTVVQPGGGITPPVLNGNLSSTGALSVSL